MKTLEIVYYIWTMEKKIQSTIETVMQRVLVKKNSDGQVIEKLHKIVF